MVDITLCIQEICGLKDNCYRHIAKPETKYQSVSSFQPKYQVSEGWSCEYYMKKDLYELRQQAINKGMRLLSEDEVLKEVKQRRSGG